MVRGGARACVCVRVCVTTWRLLPRGYKARVRASGGDGAAAGLSLPLGLLRARLSPLSHLPSHSRLCASHSHPLTHACAQEAAEAGRLGSAPTPMEPVGATAASADDGTARGDSPPGQPPPPSSATPALPSSSLWAGKLFVFDERPAVALAGRLPLLPPRSRGGAGGDGNDDDDGDDEGGGGVDAVAGRPAPATTAAATSNPHIPGVLGRCVLCDAPWDTYAWLRCARCGVLVLVCAACQDEIGRAHV